MRAITEGLLFREAAAAELGVLDCAGDIAIGIDEIDCSSDADRTALRIYKSLHSIH